MKTIFSDIAPKYDFINRFISCGQIQRWRQALVAVASPPPTGRILDLCAGTGEVSMLLAKKNPEAQVLGIDFCPEMIAIAKQKVGDELSDRVEFRVGDAMQVPLPSDSFDCITIAFGLRNVESIPQVIREMHRLLKPGGTALCLDLGKPEKNLFGVLYYGYFYRLLPHLGKLLHGNKGPYAYLSDSLKDFPSQQKLKELFLDGGLTQVDCLELSCGIVAIHSGIKIRRDQNEAKFKYLESDRPSTDAR